MNDKSRDATPLRVFYSYSHKDEAHRERLQEGLALLRRQGLISDWHDRDIDAGTDWKESIDRHLEAADIILLLISPSFIASDYCYDKEMQRALVRHERGEARVIPVIVRPSDWHDTPFGKLQALPKDAKPVTTWPNQDEAWLDVTRGIRRVVEHRAPVNQGTTQRAQERPVSRRTPRRGGSDSIEGIARDRIDTSAMLKRAEEMLPRSDHDARTKLYLIVATDTVQVIRPAALTVALGREIQQQAQFGDARILDASEKTDVSVQRSSLFIEQAHAAIRVSESGSLSIMTTDLHRRLTHGEAIGIVQEDIEERLQQMLSLADVILQHIDQAGQIRNIVILGVLTYGSYISVKTLAEYQQDPQSWSMSRRSSPIQAHLTPLQRPRASLARAATEIAEDLTALIYRGLAAEL